MKRMIRGGTVVGYNGESHVLIRGGVVVWEDDQIVYVGREYTGPVEVVVDATDKLITPGFINLHFHAGVRLQFRLTTDIGDPQFFGGGYLNWHAQKQGQLPRETEEHAEVGAALSLVELLTGGCTTVMEVGASGLLLNHLRSQAEALGLRAYLGPGYRSATYYRDDRGVLQFDWDHEAGFRGLEEAVAFIKANDGAADGRIRGALFPMQMDTCSLELLEETARKGQELGVPVQSHVGQNLLEFHEVLRHYGRTPVELLSETGLLRPGTILGHCIMVSGHPQAHYPDGRDLEMIAAAGAAVAHCPISLGRRGMHLHTLSSYVEQGITLGLGTDIYPMDMLREMRAAALLCKVASESPLKGTAGEVFDAATLGGARALGRDDLGRLCTGAKADIVVINQDALHYGAVWDPIRSLVDCGVAGDVRTVVVDGRVVVEDGKAHGVSHKELLERARGLALASAEAYARVSWDGKTVEEAFPNAYAWVDALPPEYAGEGGS